MITSDTNDTAEWTVRNSYGYIDSLIRYDWPWEFLRRHPKYQASWSQTHDAFEIMSREPALTVIRARTNVSELERWGCLYTDMPNIDARSANVFWLPSRNAGVLHMHAMPASAGLDTALFDLRTFPASVLIMPDGIQHIVFRGNGHGIQLAISGASMHEPVYLLADSVLGLREARWRLASLQRFNDLRAGAPLPPAPAERHAARLKFVLQALDGSLAGALQRDIAVALFGEERVEAEWNDPRQTLRNRVRKAIRRGRALMRGGYLRFLR